MRKRFIWDRSEQRMVEVLPEIREDVEAPFVHGDEMNKTWHPCDGRYYESKSQYRAVTAAHGCVEIGNEKIRPKPKQISRDRIAEHIRTAREQLNFHAGNRQSFNDLRRSIVRGLEQRDNMKRDR